MRQISELILKVLCISGLFYLTAWVENIYLTTVSIIAIFLFAVWIFLLIPSRKREDLWKILWDAYDPSTLAIKFFFATVASVNGTSFRVNVSETKNGLIMDRILPRIVKDHLKENRGSGPMILIPWADIHESRILPLKGKSHSYVLMFKLKKKYDVKVYWNTDRLKYCSSERLN